MPAFDPRPGRDVQYVSHDHLAGPFSQTMSTLARGVRDAWARSQGDCLVVVALGLASLAIRTWQIGWDLPYVYHPDEPYYVWIVQNIFKTGNPNPNFFNYPSLFLYLNTLAYVPYFAVGKAFGAFHTKAEILAPTSLALGVTIAPNTGVFILGRAISILFGSLSAILAYFIGHKLTHNRWTGILAALMIAVSPTAVSHSRLITSDVYVMFFMLLTILASLPLLRPGAGRLNYIAAGIAAGLTISSKYNGALILLSVHAAHFLRPSAARSKQRNLYFALGAAMLAFLVTTPFSILDFQRFGNDLLYEIQHYRSGHPGMEGNALQWYLSYLWRIEGISGIIALLGILLGIGRRSKNTIFLSVFPVAYFALISTLTVRNDRTLVPILPFLFLLASDMLLDTWHRVRQLKAPKIASAAVVAVAVLMVALPSWNTLQDGLRLTRLNQSRSAARNWLAETISPGSSLAVEAYSPYVDPSKYAVEGVLRIIDHPQNWYVRNGFDYLVFSKAMFGVFYQDPQKYASEVNQYNAFFDAFQPVAALDDGFQEIHIYRVVR